MQFDDISVGKRIFVGDGEPLCLGNGVAGPPLPEIRGSGYIEGPLLIGDPGSFPPPVKANLMVGPNKNPDCPTPIIPGAVCGFNHSPYSLCVDGDAAIFNNLSLNGQIEAGTHVLAAGEVISRYGGGFHILSMKKNFDIPHPSREGWRLRHTCPEGPYNDVYIRGRVTNKKEIELPDYWKDFVDITTITVNLTPIGAHQHVIIKRIDEEKVYLQSQGNMPIDCFYHIYAERKDGDRLIPEYPGTTPQDYPGDNSQYSVVGWNYDVR